MKTDQITPFITACENTFKTLLGVIPQRDGNMTLLNDMFPVHEVMALIAFTGSVRADMILVMDKEVACQAVGNLLELDKSVIDKEVVDGVAVILNIIATSASHKLPGPKNINLGLPTIVVGGDYQVFADTHTPWINIPMKAAGIGKFIIAITMEDEQCSE
ncbi:MAG: chemotaxis protein CheX [Lentisphaeraceae bacterium]|nr:chemotaxis protein CheX [Lentisphaeraceae bacterium]